MKKIAFFFFLALLSGAAQAAIIYLKEGGQLEGTVVSSTDREVILDTSQGRVSIDLNRVARIDYAAGTAPAREAAPPPAPSVTVPPPEYRVRRWRRRPDYEEPPSGPRSHNLSFDVGGDAALNSVSLSGTSGGNTANDGDGGVLVGMQYLYRPSRQVALGLEFHYYDRSPTDSPNLLPSAESHVFGDSELLMGVVKFSLVDRGFARPFVLLGAGGARTSTTVNAHPQFGSAWSDTGTTETRTLVNDSAFGAAGSARFGVDFGFANPYVFSLEAGWTGVTSATYGATAQGQALGITGVRGPVNYFTFAARFGWDF
jgi:hypothetical protein